jgi:hypothetical protein
MVLRSALTNGFGRMVGEGKGKGATGHTPERRPAATGLLHAPLKEGICIGASRSVTGQYGLQSLVDRGVWDSIAATLAIRPQSDRKNLNATSVSKAGRSAWIQGAHPRFTRLWDACEDVWNREAS